METKELFVTYTNQDLTEGRGMQYPIAVSDCRETCLRLGKKKYVMGSDCPVTSVTCIKVEGLWYIPLRAVDVIRPSKEDLVATNRQVVIQKMLASGFSNDEINLVTGK